MNAGLILGRSNLKRVSAGMLAACILLTIVPALTGRSLAQTSAVNIEFLNPSSFSLADGVGILVSDKQPVSPDEGDTTYRLSAWVSALPPDPAVEFEILKAGVSLLTLDEITPIGTDTFEADWDIPNNLAEGTYTIRATVASGGVGIDTASQEVVINRVAERVEMTYPDSRADSAQPSSFGTYTPLGTALQDGIGARGLPVGNVDGVNTGNAPGSGASRVRAFYTVSPPGSKPDWIVCGTETAPGDALLGSAANNGVRCTLREAAHQTLVTAVALVANSSNGGFDARLNGAGDATRVLSPYAQFPSELSFVEGETGRVDSGPEGYSCWSASVFLADQFGREITGANLDVHATGPTDALKFGRGFIDDSGQVPDRNNHASEPGFDCFGGSDDTEPEDQGEHQVIGGPDVKHIETVSSGTSDAGAWAFALHVPAGAPSPTRGTSYFSVWADEADDGSAVNDDAFATGELCVAGSVGWDRAPEAFESGSLPLFGCEPAIEPDPEPEPEPEPEPTQNKVTLRSSDSSVFRGSRVTFSGRVQTIDAACSPQRKVVLKSRKGDGRFRNRVDMITTSEGRWTLARRMYRTRDWRLVAPATDECERLRSRIVRVTVL